MAKMIIMQGLPASGKSTKAQELLNTHGNCVRINKDLIRTMLHFDKFTGKNEGMTRKAARLLARQFLSEGTNVIIDDTNLNPRTLQSWVDLAKELDCKIQHEKLDTPINECLRRDAVREKSVGAHVIYRMALSSGLYPIPEKGLILCDIDGTLANLDHRLHYVKDVDNKDWKSFFSAMDLDLPRNDVVDFVMEKEDQGYGIVIVTARPETYREVTEKWLEDAFHGYKPYVTVLMRYEGDTRPDEDVKRDMLHYNFPNKSDIKLVIDDRPKVIRMWEEEGLTVKDVGAGVEF